MGDLEETGSDSPRSKEKQDVEHLNPDAHDKNMQFFLKKPQMNKIRVIYALEKLPMYQRESLVPAAHTTVEVMREEQVDRFTRAKKAAMKLEAKAFYSQYPGQTWKNII